MFFSEEKKEEKQVSESLYLISLHLPVVINFVSDVSPKIMKTNPSHPVRVYRCKEEQLV